MKKLNLVMFAGVAGYFLAAFASLGITLALISPDQRDQSFWLRMAWTEFLILLIYLPIFSFIRAAVSLDPKPLPVIGVLPAAKIIILVYSPVSFVLMWMNTISAIPNDWHLALQISLGFLAGTLFTLISVTHSSAAIGIEKCFSTSASPTELSVLLLAVESLLKINRPKDHRLQLANRIRSLAEIVKYSLSDTSKTSLNKQYQDFAEQVQSFCRKVELVSESDSPDCFAELNESSQMLTSKAQYLSKLILTK